MESYSTASSNRASANTTPCQLYSPLPIRSPISLDICINLSEDAFFVADVDLRAKTSCCQRPNKMLMKKLRRLDHEDDLSSDNPDDFDLSFSDEQDNQSIKKINDLFMYASFIKPPSRASNPQIYDEAFYNQSTFGLGLEKNQLEQNA